METDDFKFDWVSCDGGPLLLVEEKYLTDWEGSNAPPNGRVVEANFRWGLEVATDYDRACDVKDWLGLMDVGEGKAIVLGEDETATMWLPLLEKQEGMLVRWIYADSDEVIINTAKSLSNELGTEEGFEFAVGDSDLVLFAACEAGSNKIYPRLKFSFLSGTYKIFTSEYKDERTSMICHHFKKV